MRGIPHGVIYAYPTDNELDIDTIVHAANAAVPFLGKLPRHEAAYLAWQFVRYHVRYFEEKGDQYIRMPWRTVADGVCDCKSSAVLIASLCARSGCRSALRFVIRPGDAYIGHVYAVINGTPSDPLFAFGDEIPHIRRIDFPVHG